tara:strand:- start:4627 stop:5265 length:639 start_codon:yes stop_codon:yes gene_type:complete
MTLGDGIFWSTVLILLATGIYYLSAKKKWKIFGKMLGLLILVGVVISGGVWGWLKYQDRPQVTTTLGGISLGMEPVEVSLELGEPTNKIALNEVDDPRPGSEFGLTWIYASSGSSRLVVRFYGSGSKNLTTAIICSSDIYAKVAGVGRYDSEEQVIERLGEPTNVSISPGGTSKWISYEKWLACFQIEKGRVTDVGLTRSGKIEYLVEYGEE